jgi:hypothetical protein
MGVWIDRWGGRARHFGEAVMLFWLNVDTGGSRCEIVRRLIVALGCATIRS